MTIKKSAMLFALFLAVVAINSGLILSLFQDMRLKSSQNRILKDLEALELETGSRFGTTAPFVLGAIDQDVKLVDGRAANLRRYLRSVDSPLFEHADLIVEQSDLHGFDYRVLVAISMQESGGCRVIPPGSHNCWGWGIYGGKVTRFASYEEAIGTVARGIKKNYIDKGLVTTEDIMSKYTPSSTGSWAWGIRHFFQKIESQ